jgi:glycosyltransferase involved in cell wall biosynthesis
MRVAVRTLGTEMTELRRTMQRLLERFEGRDPDAGPERVAATPSYYDAKPRVSVTITLHNYEREVVDALRSVAASEFDDYEVLVLDDASQDGSVAAVRQFLAAHPWMPAALLRHRVNRGLGASRNALTQLARGELIMILDADNTIYSSALARLVQALDHDPGATFAYPLLAVTRSDRPIGLLSRYAWDPGGLRTGNYIDAMAMIRLDDLQALGGYTEDPRLASWEDFYLWCTCAESGRRGTLVPEVLARYRDSGHSMLSWTQTDVTTAWSLMQARFPRIVGPTYVPCGL